MTRAAEGEVLQTAVEGPTPWEPGTVRSAEDGELHVFSFDTEEDGPHSEPGGRPFRDRNERRLRGLLADLLGRREHEVPLSRDGYGRLRVDGLPIGLTICDDGGRLGVALASGTQVALSAHPVPRAFAAPAYLPFTEHERRTADLAPDHQRPRFLARLWARKEAALRLAGPGRLSLADQVDALPGGWGGEVLVPEPLPGGGQRLRGAYVVDLPETQGGWVAAAATSAPLRAVRVWRLGAPRECVTG